MEQRAREQTALRINGREIEVDAAPGVPLLWVLRDRLGLTGTKYSCGIGVCGACTVLVDDRAVRSCVVRMAEVAGRSVTTIEGLSDGTDLHPVQQAWVDARVPQCGYCQVGQIMAVVGALHHLVDEATVLATIDANLCRCGSYPRIREAIRRVVAELNR